MKYLIASDLHGSAYYAKKIVEIKDAEKADKLIFLGDIYNHGPRNPLPEKYAPLEVADILNSIKDDLIVIEGNCDSQVDTMISQFDFIKDVVLETNGKSILLTHGHIYNKDNKPKSKFNAVIYGHFHTGFIESINGTIYANAGSLSLPKNNTPSSYIIIENGVITLKDIDGKVIESKQL